MSESIYTTALKYGHDHFFKGVTYNEVKIFVEKEHKTKFDYHSERAFFDWFIEAFNSTKYSPNNGALAHIFNNILIAEYFEKTYSEDQKKQVDQFRGEYKFFISGESARKYLEFQELQEARKSAREAFKMAVFAILISVVGIALEVFLTR